MDNIPENHGGVDEGRWWSGAGRRSPSARAANQNQRDVTLLQPRGFSHLKSSVLSDKSRESARA